MAQLPYHIAQAPLGGGGLVRDIDVVTNGGNTYAAHYTDGVVGMRLYPGDAQWIALNDAIHTPQTVNSGSCAWAIVIAPSDPTRIYMMAGAQSSNSSGVVWVSSDSGA